LTDLDFTVHGCDACTMGGRLSKFVGRTSGLPYGKDTFEAIMREDDSDADEDDEEVDRIRQEFNLGRFCANRARVYHSFTHWKYLLYTSLKSEVDGILSQGKRLNGKAFVRVTWGAKVPLPHDVTDGDEVMKWLDDRGIIQAEWRKLKKLMEGAHHLDSRTQQGDLDL